MATETNGSFHVAKQRLNGKSSGSIGRPLFVLDFCVESGICRKMDVVSPMVPNDFALFSANRMDDGSAMMQ